ncbi:MAG: beta-N-acetylhexosaminidase [Alphaproteobacteria bacterium]
MSGVKWEAHRAIIFGLSGLALTPEEIAFLEEFNPFGFILFGRNCQTPDQLRELVEAIRRIPGQANAPILIDQEGGRVSRLKEPGWRHPPAARLFGKLSEQTLDLGLRAAYLNARIISSDLTKAGINVDCAPVLDVLTTGTHKIIGDRGYSLDANLVAKIGDAVCRGFMDGGIIPVIKHIPGHGRAVVDSHLELPKVAEKLESLKDRDFIPFRGMSEGVWAMTAHILFESIDSEFSVTHSKIIIRDIIRSEIGFSGLLVSDDIGMGALKGSLSERALKALEAGCDVVLHCSGDLSEMKEIAPVVPLLGSNAVYRIKRSLSVLSAASDRENSFSITCAEEELTEILQGLG